MKTRVNNRHHLFPQYPLIQVRRRQSFHTPCSQVLQSAFSNGGGGSPNDPLTGDGRFTYITAGGAGDVAVASQSTDVVAQAGGLGQTLGQVTSAGGGQFYVMMSPQDVLQVRNTIR